MTTTMRRKGRWIKYVVAPQEHQPPAGYPPDLERLLAPDEIDGAATGPDDLATEPQADPAEEEETDAGMSTVEYAVGTIAAAAFAAVLYQIVTGDSVVSGLTRLINSALSGV